MKKIIKIVLTIVVVLSLFGCSNVVENNDVAEKDYSLLCVEDNCMNLLYDGNNRCIDHYIQFSSSPTIGGIKWKVIDEDKENGKKLLLSQYAVSTRAFHPWTFAMGEIDLTWEECNLRNWLNTTFIDNHFSDLEKEHIVLSSINTYGADIITYETGWHKGNGVDYNVCCSTQDKIFTLSAEEVFKYGLEEGCVDTKQGNESIEWWLRSNIVSSCADCVGENGTVLSGKNVHLEGYADIKGSFVGYEKGVRPAMWVRYK